MDETSGTPTTVDRSMGLARSGRMVYFIFGAIEALLAFRFVFKLLGANPSSPFVNFIYGFSGFFHAPFSGIFSRVTTKGAETTAVFEPSTLIAMAVYAIVAAGLVRLLVASSDRPDQVAKGLNQ